MHFQPCRAITLSLILLSAASCHRGGAVSSLKKALPNDSGHTSILKIPSPSGGEELILKSLNYQTQPATPVGYRIVCSQPSEKNTFLTSLGFDPASVATQPLAYDDPDSPPPAVTALGWQQHPDLRCPADSISSQDQLSLLRSQQDDRTVFYLKVASSPQVNRTKNLYELGCKGIPESMGLRLQDATIIDPVSFISGSGGKIYDVNCKDGQVADLVPFVNECERAFQSSTRDDAQDAYVSFMGRMQENGFTGTSCTQLWNDVKSRTSLEFFQDLQLASLAPFRYLTKLQKLKLPNNFITDLSPIQGLTMLQELDLSENTDLDQLQDLSGLKSLKTLNLSHSSVRNINALSALKKLENLDLADTLVRLPNLDALKALRLKTVNLADLNLVWRADEQTFFTNCYGLKNLPEIDKQSFANILRKVGVTAFNPNMEPTPSCFSIYRDVMDASVWPEIDLSAHMTFETMGSNGTRVTACLKPEVLSSLNELPARIKLDYENCKLNNPDLSTILKVQKLSSLDLHGTGLTDLTPLTGYANIRNLVLELTDLNAPPEKCPVNSSNEALNAYCQSRRGVSIEALKPVQMLASTFGQVPLVTTASQTPQDQIRIELVRSTCGTWLNVNDKGEASGIWPIASESCIATLRAKGLTSTSGVIDITLQNGTPKISVAPRILTKKTFARVVLGQATSPEAGVSTTIILTSSTCSWLSFANGEASGTFPVDVTSCLVNIAARSKYGVSADALVTIVNATPRVLPKIPENGLPGAFNRVLLAQPQTVAGDDSGSIRAIAGSCLSGMVVNYDGQADGIWNTPDLTCDLTLQALSTYGESDPVTVTIKRQKQENLPRIDGDGNNNYGGQYCAINWANDLACWGVGIADIAIDSTVYPISPAPQRRFTDAIQFSSMGNGMKCVLRAGGTVRCDGVVHSTGPNGKVIQNFVRSDTDLPDMKGIIQVAAGGRHACGLRADGRVLCWGNNAYGQLGIEPTANPYSNTPVLVPNLKARYLSAGQGFSCAITDNGGVVCWGQNYSGTLGHGGGGPIAAYIPYVTRVSKEAKMLDSSTFSTCAVMVDGTAECWGMNYSGQLGMPTGAEISVPQVLQGLNQIKSIRLNASTTCAVTTNAEAYCWGRNEFGQLGNGTISGEMLPIPTKVGDHFGSVADIIANETACSVSTTNELFCWGTLVVDDGSLDRVDRSTLPRSFGRF